MKVMIWYFVSALTRYDHTHSCHLKYIWVIQTTKAVPASKWTLLGTKILIPPPSAGFGCGWDIDQLQTTLVKESKEALWNFWMAIHFSLLKLWYLCLLLVSMFLFAWALTGSQIIETHKSWLFSTGKFDAVISQFWLLGWVKMVTNRDSVANHNRFAWQDCHSDVV